MTVAEGACISPPSPLLHRTRPCYQPPCPRSGHGQWVVGDWSQCSTKCGSGVKTRSVLCPTADCAMSERPETETPCSLPPCYPQPQSHRPSHVWLYTEWSKQCTASCGSGVQSRRVVCSAGTPLESLCDASLRPTTQQACSSSELCGPAWFTGPWSQCTASCGLGYQSRLAVCLAQRQDVSAGAGASVLSVVPEDSCSPRAKPVTEQPCHSQPCGPHWYTAGWSQCSRSCETGVQRREVRCLDHSQRLATGCDEADKPPSRRSCNNHTCSALGDVEREKAANSEDSPQNDVRLRDQPQPVTADSRDGRECKDWFQNCHLVVQARLCKYKYYRSSCCQACHNKL